MANAHTPLICAMPDTLFEFLLQSITVFTLLVQLYLLFLIQFHSPKSIASYRFFLCRFTASLRLLLSPNSSFSFKFGTFFSPSSSASSFSLTRKSAGVFSLLFTCFSIDPIFGASMRGPVRLVDARTAQYFVKKKGRREE